MTSTGASSISATFDSVSCDDVTGLRAQIRHLAERAGVAPSRLGDVELVTSELLSNACEHGSDVRVDVTGSSRAFEIEVSNAAGEHAVPQPHAWSMPEEPLAPSGRGLPIVGRVADDVATRWRAGRVRISVRFRTRP